jgi:O-acetyl-ADP-ribose deacetylase (regulator of RNase III)
MGEGNEEYKLRKAVRSSLLLASEKGFRSISMPAISSGIFGFPKEMCAKILVEDLKHSFKIMMIKMEVTANIIIILHQHYIL